MSKFKRVYLRPASRQCPACDHERELAWNNQRRIAFVVEALDIDYRVYVCTTPGCPLEGKPVKPELLATKVLPKQEFGLDVIRLIGYYRLKLNLSFPKIRTALIDVHEVLISEREVEDLFNLYVALSTTDVRNDPELVARLREQGRLVLTIDGAKPDADGDVLWLIRDHISAEVLLGFTAPSIDAEGIAAKIKEVVALGITIAGVTTDGEPVVVRAVELALKGVPHQLCQYHFLDNFAKGVKKLDSELALALAQDVKGLKGFEKAADLVPSEGAERSDMRGPASLAIAADIGAPKKKAGRPRRYERLCRPRDAEEAQFVRDVCEVARAAIGGSGRPPLETPGLERFERAAALVETLAACARKKGGFPSSSASTSTGR